MRYEFVKLRGAGQWIKGSPAIGDIVNTSKGYRRVISGTIVRDGYSGFAAAKVEVVAKGIAEKEIEAQQILSEIRSWIAMDCIGPRPHDEAAEIAAKELLTQHPRRRWA